jgi:opacity protein-like surface antigen
LENLLKKLILLSAAFCLVLLSVRVAHAQQFDLAFGVGTVSGQSPSDAFNDIQNHTPQSIGGGGYPAFSGDFLFIKKYFGVGGEVAWRGHQNVDIFFNPYRPILYDFNAVYGPPLGKKAQADLQAGIGLESLRFYQPFFTCNFVGCTNFQSSNHFLIHVGGGLRFYVTNSIFIRPEAHYYFVHNNFEFSGPRVARYGVSLGYSLKNRD